MVSSEGDELLGADLYASLSKVEDDMLQITRNGTENGSSAPNYVQGNLQGLSLNLRYVLAKYKDKVRDMSDSNKILKHHTSPSSSYQNSKIYISKFKEILSKVNVAM